MITLLTGIFIVVSIITIGIIAIYEYKILTNTGDLLDNRYADHVRSTTWKHLRNTDLHNRISKKKTKYKQYKLDIEYARDNYECNVISPYDITINSGKKFKNLYKFIVAFGTIRHIDDDGYKIIILESCLINNLKHGVVNGRLLSGDRITCYYKDSIKQGIEIMKNINRYILTRFKNRRAVYAIWFGSYNIEYDTEPFVIYSGKYDKDKKGINISRYDISITNLRNAVGNTFIAKPYIDYNNELVHF